MRIFTIRVSPSVPHQADSLDIHSGFGPLRSRFCSSLNTRISDLSYIACGIRHHRVQIRNGSYHPGDHSQVAASVMRLHRHSGIDDDTLDGSLLYARIRNRGSRLEPYPLRLDPSARKRRIRSWRSHCRLDPHQERRELLLVSKLVHYRRR